jgi:predicted transcriptional regulator of viral defense system
METEMMDRDKVKQIFDEHGGLMKAKDLHAAKIFYKKIQSLTDDGLIQKVRPGWYQWLDDDNLSDARLINQLYPDGVINMDSALFYYRYSDWIPRDWHIAVSKDSSKSRFKIDWPTVHPYYVEPSLLELGLTTGDIDGNPVRIYDKERTICDVLRYRHKMDREIFSKAIINFVQDSKKSIPRFVEYADKLHVMNVAQELIGIWMV